MSSLKENLFVLHLLDLGYYVISEGLLKAIISWSGREHLLGVVSFGVLHGVL